MTPRVLRHIANLLLTVWLAATPTLAQADVQDYCAAVARDFADLRPKDKDIWQQRFDGAEADCVEQFTASPAVAATETSNKPKPKPAAKPAVANKETLKKSKTKKQTNRDSAVTTAATTETVEAAAPNATANGTAKAPPSKPKLVAGSPQWLDYCARKYTSFDKTKGTYRSKTGVERKCLITADFR